MSSEQEQKQLISNPKLKEFQSLLDEDFKKRKLKENEIIKAKVTEITKNFVVVDCFAKMEGMIPIEEFKQDKDFDKLWKVMTEQEYDNQFKATLQNQRKYEWWKEEESYLDIDKS